jgi:hypothetical protein
MRMGWLIRCCSRRPGGRVRARRVPALDGILLRSAQLNAKPLGRRRSRNDNDMVTVNYEDLSLAFYFVSGGAPMEHQAYISMDTGKIYWVSDLAPTEDELPEDFEESDRYLEIPHKNDLDLGQDLALRFAEQELPGAYDRVAAFFGHRGAYRRFKDYLAEVGVSREMVCVRGRAGRPGAEGVVRGQPDQDCTRDTLGLTGVAADGASAS